MSAFYALMPLHALALGRFNLHIETARKPQERTDMADIDPKDLFFTQTDLDLQQAVKFTKMRYMVPMMVNYIWNIRCRRRFRLTTIG